MRQRKNAFASVLNGRLAVSPPIGEALAFDPAQSNQGALNVSDAKPNTVAVAEVKFREVAVQVLLTATLVDALHAALEHALEAFNGVRMHGANHVFALAVTGKGVLGKVLVQVGILAGFIGNNRRAGQHIGLDDR